MFCVPRSDENIAGNLMRSEPNRNIRLVSLKLHNTFTFMQKSNFLTLFSTYMEFILIYLFAYEIHFRGHD